MADFTPAAIKPTVAISEGVEEFEKARKKFGQKGEDFITKCYALHEAFALSLRPAKSSAAIKERLMAMVRERKQP